MDNDEIEVPPFFLCPISLEIMKDPVIVSTGITYDRESIEKWLFSGKKNATCPVTKQSISPDTDLITPNHTLRRLIQSWCTVNASYGIERIPTPKPPVSRSEIEKLIRDFTTSSFSHKKMMTCLNRLREISLENGNNRRCLEAAGVPEFLTSVISNNISGGENGSACDDALSLLYNLQISENGLKKLLYSKTGNDVVRSLTRILQNGTYESRTYATLLLESVLAVTDPVQVITLNRELFEELIQIIHHQISIKATKSAFRILISVCPWGRNRHKAVEFGAVPVIIELLLDRKSGSSSEKKISEMAMVVLDLLCQCAEGRAELLGHAAGIAVVSKKLLRVSHVATERGVRVLVSVAKFCATPFLLEEMLQLGVVAKLCLVIQIECGSKAKEKATELLKLHGRVWKNSPCVPKNLIGSYPV